MEYWGTFVSSFEKGAVPIVPVVVSSTSQLSLKIRHKVLSITEWKPRADVEMVAHEDEEGEVDVVLISRPGEAVADDGVHRRVGTQQKALLGTPVRQKVEGVRILM
jgi:hypothetical protein